MGGMNDKVAWPMLHGISRVSLKQDREESLTIPQEALA